MLRGFDFTLGEGWGPSSPSSNDASHLYRAPSSALLGVISRVEDTWTGVAGDSSENTLLYTSVCSRYHLSVRYWTGAMFCTSHSSWYSLPSTKAPVWFTKLMEMLSGVSAQLKSIMVTLSIFSLHRKNDILKHALYYSRCFAILYKTRLSFSSHCLGAVKKTP